MCLEIKNLSKHYGAVIAMESASLSIREGEVRAILGGNGSGKSTLAKVLSGIVARTGGEILYNGESVDYVSPKDAKKHGVIMTSQELSLFQNLTVEDNISVCDMPVRAGFTDRKRVKERAAEVLRTMGLEPVLGKKVSELPPNQQYMVELAKALVQEPKILLIDEITSALYREDVRIVDDIIRELKNRGCIVLFISHRMEELYAMCDSVTVMRNGVTIGTWPMREKKEDELLSLMSGTKIDLNQRSRLEDEERRPREIFIRAPHVKIPSYGTEISLEIARREVVCIAGLQGHGQTDLVRSLYGENGRVEVEVDGKMLSIANARAAVRSGFAFLSGDRTKDGTFQERNLRENLSAVERLVFKREIADVDEALQRFHVKYSRQEQLITELSGGNQQKVVVGRWLMTNPVLLLMDDPSKGIDVKARYDLHSEIVKLASAGNAVVMISSDEDEIVRISSMAELARVIVMYEGTVSAVLEGTQISRENISMASMSANTKEEQG